MKYLIKNMFRKKDNISDYNYIINKCYNLQINKI